MKKTMLEKRIWAVIGANESPDKFGNIIYKRLKDRGYNVYPINPKYDSVNGDICYNDISSLPELPEVINMVISPEHGSSYIQEAANLDIKYVWFQPGTFGKEIFTIIKEHDMNAIQACVLVETEQR